MTAAPVVGSPSWAAPSWDGDIEPLLRWLHDAGAVPELELACGEHGDPERGSRRPVAVVVPGCVAEISVASYLELAAAGVSRVTVGNGACPPSARTAAVLAEAAQLLRAAGCASTVAPAPAARAKSRDVFRLHRLPLSRRRLLTLGMAGREPRAGDGTERGRAIAALHALRRRAAATAAAAASPATSAKSRQGTAAETAASSESRGQQPSGAATSSELWQETAPDGATSATSRPGPGLLAGAEAAAPSLAEVPAAAADLYVTGCTMCGVCVLACPVGSLSLDTATVDGVERHSLRLHVPSCTDCGRCTALCPEQAITRRGAVPWSIVLEDKKPRVLARAEVRHCARCQAVIPVHLPADLCEVCSFRKANPFGSRMIGPLAQKTRP